MEQTRTGQYAEPTEEQKNYKLTKDRFRSEIKGLEAKQRVYKGNFKSTDDKTRSDAQRKASDNGFTLRHHYIAYALFRGKKIPETPKHIPADQSHRAKQYFKEIGRNEWGFRTYNEDVVKKISETYAANGTTVRYNA